AIQHFQYEQNLPIDIKKGVDAMKLPCHLNLAACHLKQQSYAKVIEECNKALSINSSSVKALYRRASAYLKRVELDFALKDLEKALEIEPEDQACKVLLRTVKAEVKKYEEKDKALFKKMFR
ncbi:hypothetical protein HDU76_011742, partial [Blyttiomyces sp. JEL0837]